MAKKEEYMLKSLHLLNFQSHRDTHLEFDPGVNIIVGPSDSGKTAIIRALRWLVWNRPSGDAMRSTWGGDTRVEIAVDNLGIVRQKAKEGDKYYIVKSLLESTTDQIFKAFGTTVPEEITQALNLNEINLQQQLDRPFLLDSSPGEVAKHFNKVAHLDQIDEGLRRVQKWIRDIEQDISSKDKQLEQSNEDLESFEHLEKFEIEVEVIERMESEMIQQVNHKRVLDKLCLDLTVVEDLIEEQNKITAAGPLVDTILDWYATIEGIKQLVDKLKELTGEIYAVEDEIEQESEILGAEESVNQLISLFEEQTEERHSCSVLQKLVERIQYITEEQITAENLAKRLQTEFNTVFPDVCPLCDKPK